MPNTTPLPRRWAAYAASAAAAGYGAVSLYWTLGGSAGLHTVGGFAEQMAGSHSAQAAAVVWSVVGAKAIGVALPLGLVRAWGNVVPRRWRAIACGGVGVSLSSTGQCRLREKPWLSSGWSDLRLRWTGWLFDGISGCGTRGSSFGAFCSWQTTWHFVGEQAGPRPKASSDEEAAELHPKAKRSFSAKPGSLGMSGTTDPSLSGKERMSLSPHAGP